MGHCGSKAIMSPLTAVQSCPYETGTIIADERGRNEDVGTATKSHSGFLLSICNSRFLSILSVVEPHAVCSLPEAFVHPQAAEVP